MARAAAAFSARVDGDLRPRHRRERCRGRALAADAAPGRATDRDLLRHSPIRVQRRRKHVGFEVDLMREVADRLGLRPTFVGTRWEVILAQMEAHRYDCIVGGITITPARQTTLDYSTPYMTTTLDIIVNTVRTPEIRSLGDLK